MSLVCCQLHLSHLVNLTHDLHFCFLVFVLVIFTPPPLYFSCFNRFRVQAVFCLLTRYFSLCLFSCGIFIALARWVRLPSKLPYYFVIFPKLYFVFWFRSVFSFLNLELFVTVPLFKSSLKKDRAILSETSGQKKLVCWCWGRAKRAKFIFYCKLQYETKVLGYFYSTWTILRPKYEVHEKSIETNLNA